MAKTNKTEVTNVEQEKALARRKKAKTGEIAGYVGTPALSIIEPEIAIPEPTPEPVVEVVQNVTHTQTPFENLRTKVSNGAVRSVTAYFPVSANEENTGLNFARMIDESGNELNLTYTIDKSNSSAFFRIFAYKLPESVKGKGGKFSPKAFTDALRDGYATFANLLNEADKFTNRNLDRVPVILRIVDGTFDDGTYTNEISGVLLKYNELPHTRLVEMIDEAGINGLVTSSFMTPEALSIYFHIEHELKEKTGINLVGKILNGSDGKYAFRFNTVIRDTNNKFEYILPDVDEKGNFSRTRERYRHLGWLERGVEILTDEVEKISKINYATVLNNMDIGTFLTHLETAMTELVNDKDINLDAEKSAGAISNLRIRCGVNDFETAIQGLNEAVILNGTHGNAKYMTPMLERALDRIFS